DPFIKIFLALWESKKFFCKWAPYLSFAVADMAPESLHAEISQVGDARYLILRLTGARAAQTAVDRPGLTQTYTHANTHTLRPILGHNMANFSVEWLSKSYYEEMSEARREMEEFTKDSRDQHPPTSPNNSCGYTSGSESEVGDDSEGEASQHRRMRTKFTSEQISRLERTFSKHRYLGAVQRRKIAERLKLSETQVKTWFQNRRMKLKREVQDVRPEFLSVPASLLPPVLFQHPSLGGQLPAARGLYPQLQPAPLHQHRALPLIMPPHFY
ncbi:hypothetical protein L3Q82_011645, partial [Scortum barcoo]